MQFKELPNDEENYTRIITIDYQGERKEITLVLRDGSSYDDAMACLQTYKLLSGDPEMRLGTIRYSGNSHLLTITICASDPARLFESLYSTHTISNEIYTRILCTFVELGREQSSAHPSKAPEVDESEHSHLVATRI